MIDIKKLKRKLDVIDEKIDRKIGLATYLSAGGFILFGIIVKYFLGGDLNDLHLSVQEIAACFSVALIFGIIKLIYEFAFVPLIIWYAKRKNRDAH